MTNCPTASLVSRNQRGNFGLLRQVFRVERTSPGECAEQEAELSDNPLRCVCVPEYRQLGKAKQSDAMFTSVGSQHWVAAVGEGGDDVEVNGGGQEEVGEGGDDVGVS
ncbi:hypothetical protein Pmani_035950 [Petrolisthes manimaculis]|uniref:Uncharacterized protein n=1 Tax=Petrolisthes manimaculis TaxID=1843537 RepID=A0AAE1NKL9_9EUCA|nr:hypothetical protein Pmani_035950 [Petrolisthes manimaculis]